MRLSLRFQLRTLLMGLSLIAMAAGGARWWYNWRLAEYERQQRVAMRLEAAGASVLWSYVGPQRFEAWKALDGPLFRRPTHAYCDGVTADEFAQVVNDLAKIDVVTVVALGRQVVPHARVAKKTGEDSVMETLRRHGTLEQLVVDASIRGAPLEFDAPLYTREDLELLEEVLPGLKVIWVEVN